MDVAHSNVVLRLRGLKKSYGALLAVNDLALDVFRGEVLGLLGPNGAGKTTTINIICGLLPCDAGEVILDGRSLKDKYRDCKQMIGLCPQEVVIWESLTCLEQLELVGRLYDVRSDVARNRAIELLTIGCFPFFILMFFSGGMFPLPPLRLFTVGSRSVSINDFLPTTHTISALDRILNHDAGLGDVAFELGAILILTVVFFAAGAWLFTRRHMQAYA